jgi:hypothetical protein
MSGPPLAIFSDFFHGNVVVVDSGALTHAHHDHNSFKRSLRVALNGDRLMGVFLDCLVEELLQLLFGRGLSVEFKLAVLTDFDHDHGCRSD